MLVVRVGDFSTPFVGVAGSESLVFLMKEDPFLKRPNIKFNVHVRIYIYIYIIHTYVCVCTYTCTSARLQNCVQMRLGLRGFLVAGLGEPGVRVQGKTRAADGGARRAVVRHDDAMARD